MKSELGEITVRAYVFRGSRVRRATCGLAVAAQLSVGVVALSPVAASAAPPVDGMLDASFATSATPGLARHYEPNRQLSGHALAVDASDRAVVVGYASNASGTGVVLTRFSPVGDREFAHVDLAPGVSLIPYDVTLDSAGRIVVTGAAMNGTRAGFFVARYTSSGNLDSTFGSGGFLLDYSAGNSSVGTSVQVAAGGNIVVAGSAHNGTRTGIAIARYTDSGAPDTSFGTNGIVTDYVAGTESGGNDVAIDGAGKLVVAGSVTNGTRGGFLIARYTTLGAVDATFGSGGHVTDYSAGSDSGAVALALTDTTIIVAGAATMPAGIGFAVARYTVSGALDNTFGSSGVSAAAVSGMDIHGISLTIDSLGRIIMCGTVDEGEELGFATRRLTSGGSPDSSFGVRGDGYVFHFDQSADLVGSYVAVDSADRLLVAGTSLSTDDALVLARYTSATTPSTPGGVSTFNAYDGHIGVRYTVPGNGGSPITGITATATPGGASCTSQPPFVGQCAIPGLTNGATYSITVVATNAAGNSAPSAPLTHTLLWVPDEPTSVVAKVTRFGASVSWTPPARDGGSAITSYVVTAVPGGQQCTTAVTSCTVHLPAGDYAFNVRAVNAMGMSLWSDPSDEITLALPGAPTGVTAIVAPTGVATVSWVAPSATGGSPIESYSVHSTPISHHACLSVTVTTCTIKSLTAGTSYTFAVTALNGYARGGSSSASAPVVGVAARPSVVSPGVVSLQASGEIAPDGTLGASLSYSVVSSGDTARVAVNEGTTIPPATMTWPYTTMTSTGAVLRGLRPGVTYRIAVYAISPAGTVSLPATTTLTGSAAAMTPTISSTAGAAVALRGTLKDHSGKALPGKRVVVLARSGTSPWRTHAQAVTDARGAVVVRTRPSINTQFALRFAGEQGTLGVAVGAVGTVRVAARVAARLTLASPVRANTVRRGRVASLAGTVTPGKARQVVYLQVKVGKVWRNVRSAKLGAKSNFSFVLSSGTAGSARYRVFRPADANNVAGASAEQVLTVV